MFLTSSKPPAFGVSGAFVFQPIGCELYVKNCTFLPAAQIGWKFFLDWGKVIFFRTKCFAFIFYGCSWINFPTKIKCRTNSCIVESAFLSALQKNISFVFGILGKNYFNILGMELSPNGCFCTFGIITSNALLGLVCIYIWINVSKTINGKKKGTRK